MLEIQVGAQEHFDQATRKFVKFGGNPVRLEHSLLSLSKWEELWEKPFLGSDHTEDELASYIECMYVSGEFDASQLTVRNIHEINAYISTKRTATVVAEVRRKPGEKPPVITSELVYSWMVAHQIPVEFESWFFNRLLTLIQVCNANASNDGKKKNKLVGKGDMANRRAEMEARRAKFNTNG